MKALADDNSKFDENGRKFFKQVENTVGKGEIARSEQFFIFPTVFSKDLHCRHVKTRACLGTYVNHQPCMGSVDQDQTAQPSGGRYIGITWRHKFVV